MEECRICTDIGVTILDKESDGTGGIYPQIVIENKPKGNLILAELEIRYHFNKSGTQRMESGCDQASLKLSIVPWYVPLTERIQTKVEQDADGWYVSAKIAKGPEYGCNISQMSIQLRMSHVDWSEIKDFKPQKIVVWYKGKKICHEIYTQ